jgi:hypothetical protein
MTLRLRLHARVLLVAAAAGCGGGSDGDSQLGTGIAGGQTGEEGGAACKPVESTRLAWSERSPLGFSADELLGALGAEHSTRLTYDDGASTALTLTLERGTEGALEYQEREWMSDGSGAEIAVPECPPVVSVPVTLTFSTADVAFAEEWSFALLAENTARATASIRLDLDALRGNFTVTQVDVAEFDDVLAHLDLTLGRDGWSGMISGTATQTTGSGPDDTVSAQGFDIASF